MTKLVVDELHSTLSQTFTVYKNERLTIEAIRPYIYMHNAPAGTFTIAVKSGGTELFSKTFTSVEIKSDLSTANNYIHIWKTLVFASPAQIENGEYELELSSAGYTYSDSSYLGWVREHENLTNEISGTPVSDIENPRSFQLLTRQVVR